MSTQPPDVQAPTVPWPDFPDGAARRWVLEALDSFAETNAGAARDLRDRDPQGSAEHGQRAAAWRSLKQLAMERRSR